MKPFHHLTVAAALAVALMAPQAMADEPLEIATAFYTRLDDTTAPITTVTDLIAEDYVDHNRAANAPADLTDRQLFVGFLEQLRTGFPVMAHETGIMADIGENRVVTYWTFRARQDGEFFGMPASGKPVEIDGIDIMQIKDGKIAAMWHVEEQAALMQQLAAQP